MPDRKIPEVGQFVVGVGTLVEIQDVEPPPPPKDKDYIFSETTARAESRINDNKIADYSTFWDRDGESSCVDSAIEEAKSLIEQYGKSDMVFVVIKKTEFVRKRPSMMKNLYDNRFFDFDNLSFMCRLNVPDDIEEVVWRSDKDMGVDHEAK